MTTINIPRVWRDIVDGVLSCSSYAYLASTDATSSHVFLKRLPLGIGELFVGIDGRQPETQRVGKVMARSSGPVALDERRGSEIFQTRSRVGQRLTAAFCTSGSVLYE